VLGGTGILAESEVTAFRSDHARDERERLALWPRPRRVA
jgi:hypothetical protein